MLENLEDLKVAVHRFFYRFFCHLQLKLEQNQMRRRKKAGYNYETGGRVQLQLNLSCVW